jgi:hypothetical protein
MPGAVEFSNSLTLRSSKLIEHTDKKISYYVTIMSNKSIYLAKSKEKCNSTGKNPLYLYVLKAKPLKRCGHHWP